MAHADPLPLALAESAPVAAADAPSAAAPAILRPVSSFPVGAGVTLDRLEGDPHALLARLRAEEPVSWIPSLTGWLVTRHDLAVAVMRDERRFTVDDPRFSTSVVVGPSMLSLDGESHARQRAAFAAPFRPIPVRERFTSFVEAETGRLLDQLAGATTAELRRSYAGPLAAATVAFALGLPRDEADRLLEWYEKIVAGVSAITAGQRAPGAAESAFADLAQRLQAALAEGHGVLADASGLTAEEVVSNAAVLLFGGIETTDGMIANATLELLRHPDQLATARERPELIDAAVDESLRLEPAAAVVDRYATEPAELGGAEIGAGDLVRVSITAANRDPAVFDDPDRFELGRPNMRRHLAFAHGPHVCLGVHLARLEARAGLRALLGRFERLRADPTRPASVTGLVFRKPRELWVRWDRGWARSARPPQVV